MSAQQIANQPITSETSIGIGPKFVLGIQHAMAMFGATVLVPALTGLHPSVALLAAGLGTLLFHLVTGGKVPVFLGSSFAFIGVIQIVGAQFGLEYATGGIMVAGLVYLAISALVMAVGVERVRSFFPPVVSGPMIMVIGLGLSPVAISGASTNWTLAIITLAAVVGTAVFAKGFFKLLPIMTGLVVGFIAAAVMGELNTAVFAEAELFALPPVHLPKFNLEAIMLIAPLALVTMVEHIGDVKTNGAVIGKDLMKEPGLHRTVLGDGLATALAGFLGAPANTTYSENTGVLAITKVYDPAIIRIAAFFAIIMAFVGYLGALLQSMPGAVMGGISIVLFGMICSVGIRTVVDARVNFANTRNLVIAAVILVLGIGGASIQITETLAIGGMALAALAGILLNKLLPEHLGE